ncbi:DMT family transporter [Aliicoccus persicus]|uniref:Paired small multidrug resistance pump n=1 Tax=Aliicoccus persicus TaxID=930138 RepID=A0A662Z964_9STAP|nr:multidrug efflux SMR transporter [Aliicoccus persicus]SEW18233.1 paired small multidrug resistance pump [Aliicoccus persicus]
MSWVILIIAGLLEVVGVNGIQRFSQGNRISGLIVMVLGFSASLFLLGVAMGSIPLGVSYAVWTGMGTVGSVILGIVLYGDSASVKRIFYVSLIVVAVIGLRLVTA